MRALTPTQKEPSFGITQLLVLILFVVATVYAVKRFRRDKESAPTADTATQNRAA